MLALRLELVLWQSGHLVVEQLLGLGPHVRALSVLESLQAGQEGRTECLAGLTRQQRRQVIDGDDAEGRTGSRLDRNGRAVEGCVDVVDGNGVVWVGRVAGNIADDAQLA